MAEIDSTPPTADGERLRLLRRAMGLSQAQLAECLGCSEKTIRNHEKAKFQVRQEYRREIGQMTKVDIAPLDPSEDPYLVVKRYYEIKNSYASLEQDFHKIPEAPLENSAPQKNEPTLITWFWKIRTQNDVRKRLVLTPMRRGIENIINFIYLFASTIFAIEQFQRALGGWKQHHVYHDSLLFLSGLLALMFLLPSLLTLAWGIKPSHR